MWVVWFGCIFIGVIAVTALMDCALRRFASRKIADIFENVPPFNVVAESEIPDARHVCIQTADGLRLSGSLHLPEQQSTHGLVIFFPELSGNHWMARRYCEALLAEGFAILAFDFRNQGESESSETYTPIHWITEFEMTDVSAVLEFVESDPQLSTLPLFAFGVSRGGVAALLAGCRYPRIQAVIADSAFGTMPMAHHFVERFVRYVIPGWLYAILPAWHIRLALKQGLERSEKRRRCQYVHLENEVQGLADTPVLLISGKRDSYVTVDVATQLQKLIGPNSELWIVANAKHNMARATATGDYDSRVSMHLLKAAKTGAERNRNMSVQPFVALPSSTGVGV